MLQPARGDDVWVMVEPHPGERLLLLEEVPVLVAPQVARLPSPWAQGGRTIETNAGSIAAHRREPVGGGGSSSAARASSRVKRTANVSSSIPSSGLTMA